MGKTDLKARPSSPKAAALRNWLMMTFGTLLMVAGIYFFKFPNNFSTGGVTGAAIIFGHFTPSLSAGAFVLIINTALLIVGMIVLGRGFGFGTLYCSLLMSLGLYLLEFIAPLDAPLTGEPLLELAYSILLPAAGSAILFNSGASTGGTDIIAMIIKKYRPLGIGKALLVTDSVIVLAGLFVFGIKTGLLSILGLLGKALVVDNLIESINMSKYFIIITDRADEVCEYIHQKLGRGATVWDCEGTFTQKPRKVVLVVMNRTQAYHIRRFIMGVDSGAFIIISNTSDIIGKGFRRID